MFTRVQHPAQPDAGTPLPVTNPHSNSTTEQVMDKPGRFDTPKRSKSTSPPPCTKFKKNLFPQLAVDKFWRDFTTKKPGKPFNILPGHVRAKRAAIKASIDAETPTNAVASYEQAAAACRAEIDSIVRDCLRMNQKYKDPDFDIEWDLAQWLRHGHIEDYLVPLGEDKVDLRPRSVKRVEVSQIILPDHFFFRQMSEPAANLFQGYFRESPIQY